jgi:RND superfamily putative drug exporter
MQTRSWLARLGRLVVRRRWSVIVAWTVLLGLAGIFAAQLPSRLAFGGFEVPGSQSAAVARDLAERFPGQLPDSAVIVVQHPRLTVQQPAFAAVVDGITARVRAVAGVATVHSWRVTRSPSFVSPDRHTTYLVAELSGGQNGSMAAAPEVAAAAGAAVPPGFQVATGGAAAMWERFDKIGKVDLERAERVSLPISLLALLLAFGGLVAAGLPIMLALAGLVVGMGGLYVLAGMTDLNIFATNTASVIGIGVGIDYALFIVTRFREELRRGHASAEAVPHTMASAGRAVALSGATVIVALAGMFLVDIQAMRSMAVGAMLAVALVVAAALTLLPAVLAVLGPRVDHLHLPRSRTLRPRREGFWHRWATAVMRRPWAFLLTSLAALAVLSAPVAAMRLGQTGAGSMPRGEQPRVALERLATSFGAGVVGPIEIVVDTPGGATASANLDRIRRLTGLLRADPAVAQVSSLGAIPPAALAGGIARLDPALRPVVAGLANWDRGAGLARVTVISQGRPESQAAEDLVGRVRNRYLPAAGLAGRARVGGTTALDIDITAQLFHRLPLIVAAVLALSFLLLACAFRSLLLPLKAVSMNLLSVGAALGVLVAVFQWGWGERWLGFTSEQHLGQLTPLFLFCVLFGLSMDYEVFLLSRMREEYLHSGSNELGVARGLEATARTITAAALVMVTVFGAFASGRLVSFKEIGFGLAAAVLIDATIVRIVLVPAAMKLMGAWNWWLPGALDRWLPRVQLEPDEPPTRERDSEPVPARPATEQVLLVDS